MSDLNIILSADETVDVKRDAANARAEARLGESTAALWDRVYAASVTANVKRADAVNQTMRAAGIWRDEPQKVDGVRTPYGNVWQRMAARFDAAKKRAAADEPKPTRLAVNLSGDDVTGGTVTIDPDHPLYTTLLNLFEGADILAA